MVCLARRNYPSSSRQGVKSSSRQVVKSSNRQDFGLWVLSSRLPPEINITFWGAGEIEIDPQQDWVMIEARNGYYEASRLGRRRQPPKPVPSTMLLAIALIQSYQVMNRSPGTEYKNLNLWLIAHSIEWNHDLLFTNPRRLIAKKTNSNKVPVRISLCGSRGTNLSIRSLEHTFRSSVTNDSGRRIRHGRKPHRMKI